MKNICSKEEKSSYIMYLDANNLYAHAMSQALPISDFKWVEDDELSNLNNNYKNILEIADDANKGYIFEVDIEIPHNIHDKLNDYPIPESLKVN